MPSDKRVPAECSPDEVDFELSWSARPGGWVLRGQLIAHNVSGRIWRISGKPAIRLIGLDGRVSRARHLVTAENRIPNWMLVGPGERVAASMSWTSWDGRILSKAVMVIWPGGRKTVATSGSTHPQAAAPPKPGRPGDPLTLPMWTSSTWFNTIELP
jgi:hypothetical protein